MSVKIVKTGEDFVISNKHYECVLSVPRGGSMTKFSAKGKDMLLKREGCEYWAKNGFHYEQEFGGRGIVGYRYTKDCHLIVRVKSKLVSPGTKDVGGCCTVVWRFDDSGTVQSVGTIRADHPVLYYDRYVCFIPESYLEYFYNSVIAEIGKFTYEKAWQTWFSLGDHFCIGVSNKEKRFNFYSNGFTNATAFSSRGMIELKITYEKQNIIKADFNAE